MTELETSAHVFDMTVSALGEGPLWHPERGTLYWFDILGKTLYQRDGETLKSWGFEEHVSAAGWVDRDTLLLASDTALSVFDLKTGESSYLQGLESDNPATRSNDGRADPWGGFWISTMGLNAERGAGAIYRYYQGELRKLYSKITIPNAISFPPSGAFACFTDTVTKQIKRVALDEDGWPDGEPSIYVDLREAGRNPDGAVFDADGTLWVAEWGAARVTGYGSDGAEVGRVDLPASQPSCPAFGGVDLSTLYITTATQDMDVSSPHDGLVYAVQMPVKGLAEYQVIL